jgi:choline dehydrogenase
LPQRERRPARPFPKVAAAGLRDDQPMETFDHIVIGAGSAGCAVAARLSEDPTRKVLLVEAGGSDRCLEARAPAGFPGLFHKDRDWDYYTEPEPGCDGRRLYHPRGKLVGGCSAMNAMLWVRGSNLDYDGWDIPGWGWDDVLPHYLKLEDHFLPGDAHGHGGPMRIRRIDTPDPSTTAFVDAAVAAGIPRTEDLSGPELSGVQVSATTTSGGRRWSTARGYLDPARRRKNLTVMTGALVHRIVIDRGRAVGIDLERKGQVQHVRATQEIVLSAGAFNTPHLLQLSGVGPAAHLRDIGVDVIVDAPAVGAHLTEHPMTFVNFELREPWLGLSDAEKPKHILNWLVRGKGKLASNVGEALAHVHTRDGLPAPDMQLVNGPVYFWEHGEGEHPKPAMMIAQSYWTPQSRGTVLARSSDPREKPAVQLNLLTAQEDVDAMVRGVRLARRIAEQGPLSDMLAAEITPGPVAQTDAELEAWVRATCQHTYHAACSARIGEPGDGVLDPELRVHGVEHLRVADASVLPTITRANTNAPAIMVGERCAAFIRGDDAIAARPRRAARTGAATGAPVGTS